MALDLVASSRLDLQSYLQAEWKTDILFDGVTVVPGFATKHHLKIDPDTGTAINVKNSHILVSETELVELGINPRDVNEEIDLIGVQVSWADSSGVVKNYRIDENWPSESTGGIVCILGDLQI